MRFRMESLRLASCEEAMVHFIRNVGHFDGGASFAAVEAHGESLAWDRSSRHAYDHSHRPEPFRASLRR